MTSATNSPRPTRNAERTRSAILTAATDALVERGTGASLAYIAKQAGVSKGGLMHHFANREALIVVLVNDANRRFRESVLNHLDLSENTPGKMLRAYVRALCSGDEDTVQYFTSTPTWAGIHDIPEAVESAWEDSQWWAQQLALDGLSTDRILVVRHAAEGLAVALAYGEETADSVAAARDLLLGLTEGDSLQD